MGATAQSRHHYSSPFIVTRISSRLLELIVEQRENAARGLGLVLGAVFGQDLHLGAASAVDVLDLDAVLLGLGLLGAVAPELQTGEPAFLLGLLVGARVDIAHEVQALRAVLVFDRKADTVEREADTPPGAVELVI